MLLDLSTLGFTVGRLRTCLCWERRSGRGRLLYASRSISRICKHFWGESGVQAPTLEEKNAKYNGIDRMGRPALAYYFSDKARKENRIVTFGAGLDYQCNTTTDTSGPFDLGKCPRHCTRSVWQLQINSITASLLAHGVRRKIETWRCRCLTPSSKVRSQGRNWNAPLLWLSTFIRVLELGLLR
jgi:hypothetical protein